MQLLMWIKRYEMTKVVEESFCQFQHFSVEVRYTAWIRPLCCNLESSLISNIICILLSPSSPSPLSSTLEPWAWGVERERWSLPVFVFDHYYYDHHYYNCDHHYHHNENLEQGGLRERWSLPLPVCWSRGLSGSTTLWSLCAVCLKHTHTITQTQTHMHKYKVITGTRP